MSWGADLVFDDRESIELVSGHTYNLTSMWRLAGVCDVTRDIDGLKAYELGARCTRGVLKALQEPQKFRELNPPNGWGDFEGFLEIIIQFALLCNENPEGIVVWNG